MHLTLFDHSPTMVAAWQKTFTESDQVSIRCCRLGAISDADAIVAAGNSYGVMDGGLDLAMARRWTDCQRDVAQVLVRDWGGYIPVGAAAIVEANPDSGRPLLVYAPTMRRPITLMDEEVFRLHDALHTALWALYRYDRERDWQLACPGLGTGIGRVPAITAARLMAEAWINFTERAEAAVGVGPALAREANLRKARLPQPR